ncbi:hypothetical protein A7Q09_04585 [Methylacidiphilum sp. Yel]|uniref:DprA-like winged helix domain-containing protein n=1 Tax=Methylacidiphilum sp. Yel TaxID=1847730 RepID=UPI00106B14EE|nr:hypothetical protein [Methylacidiphilum sp. Yel]TFE70063.1 hypothetical protein A7Q09_04585 [Methylacidiphilum sp. Yel]
MVYSKRGDKERASKIKLSKDEQQVYLAMEAEETSIEELVRKTGLALATLFSVLNRLGTKKIVCQLPLRRYDRTL